MERIRSTSYKFSILVILSTGLSLSQGKTAQDSSVLMLIKQEGAFLHWQTTWEDLDSSFALESFRLHNQHDFPQRVLDSLRPFDMSRIDHPSMLAFSPNGLKVVAFGYAQTCGDDYCSVFLYDLRHSKVFELSAVGMNLPPFNGFSWLNNDLLVMVGESYHFTRETVLDSVAPSVTAFNFHTMRATSLIGNFVPRDEYMKTFNDRVTVEPDLMLYYHESIR